MAGESEARTRAVCDKCGFTAPDGSDDWISLEHPPLGRITQCPECGSTNVFSRG